MLGKALLFSLLTTTGAAAAPTDSLTLYLNLPSYRLEVWEGSEKIRSYWVTIGAPEFQTPTGSFAISRIEWNPRWVPPPSPWAKDAKEKGPGKGNPMGRVKLQFDDYLYVHGTWRPDELGGPYSHGCVRLKNEDALDLARLIALRQGVVTEREVNALEGNSGRTRSVRLAHAIPLRIRYDLSAVVEGDAVDYEDPYGWANTERSTPTVTESTAGQTDRPGGS
jgi:murein L,D-transpeptidase YcbB/YkuD